MFGLSCFGYVLVLPWPMLCRMRQKVLEHSKEIAIFFKVCRSGFGKKRTCQSLIEQSRTK